MRRMLALTCLVTGAACTSDWSVPHKDAASEDNQEESEAGGDEAGHKPMSEAPAPDTESGLNPSIEAGATPEAKEAGQAPLDAAIDTGLRPNDSGASLGDADSMDGGYADAALGDTSTTDAAGTCATSPCQNGGTCTDGPSGAACGCLEPFTGPLCELEICPTTYIRTNADLETSRLCAEIRGNLNIATAGLAQIGANDLPNLNKVTGDIVMSPLNNNGAQTPSLQTITLTKLSSVGGSITVYAPGAGSALELQFPALAEVGTNITIGGAETKTLRFPVLTTVGGSLNLMSLSKLCTVDLRRLSHIEKLLNVSAIYNVPASAFDPLRPVTVGTSTISNVGCCFPLDKVQCDSFTTEQRTTYCGC